jgi:hypothetical protein
MMLMGIMPVRVMPVPSARSTRPCRISIVARNARRAEREGSEGLRQMHRWPAVLTSHDDVSGAASPLAQDKRVNASRMPIRAAFVDKITPVPAAGVRHINRTAGRHQYVAGAVLAARHAVDSDFDRQKR